MALKNLAMIAAVTDNGCIGLNNELLYRIPEDMQHFKDITLGYPVVMGRNTWDSLDRKPLPGRRNIIISRTLAEPEDHREYSVVRSEVALYNLAAFDRNTTYFIIGGSQIYNAFMNLCSELYITHIHSEIHGDAFFPKIEDWKWKEVSHEDCEHGVLKFTFSHYKLKADN
jgi:dihydrofolate reductase